MILGFQYSPVQKTVDYFILNFAASGGVTLTNNLTNNVNIQKTGGTDNSWTQQAYTTQGYSAPLTLEFNKSVALSGDDTLSYAMIGFNADPTTDDSYASIDYAAYPYRSDLYNVHHNGTQVHSATPWDQSQKFYLVYDGTNIKHYNGSTLLYTSPSYTVGTVYIDTSFYRVNQTNCRFTNVKLSNKIWNGTQYL